MMDYRRRKVKLYIYFCLNLHFAHCTAHKNIAVLAAKRAVSAEHILFVFKYSENRGARTRHHCA